MTREQAEQFCLATCCHGYSVPTFSQVVDALLAVASQAAVVERRRCVNIARRIDHGRRGDGACCEHVSRDIAAAIERDQTCT